MRAIVLALGILAAAQPAGAPRDDVYAVRFAHVPYAESSLVAGAAKGPQAQYGIAAASTRQTRRCSRSSMP